MGYELPVVTFGACFHHSNIHELAHHFVPFEHDIATLASPDLKRTISDQVLLVAFQCLHTYLYSVPTYEVIPTRSSTRMSEQAARKTFARILGQCLAIFCQAPSQPHL